MSDSMNIDEQSEEIRGRGKRASGGASIELKDSRVSKLFEFAQPILSALALAAILYFANKVGDLGDAMVKTNTQIAIIIEQNRMTTDGFKDHENRIRTLEGRTFRGIPGYGDETEKPNGK